MWTFKTKCCAAAGNVPFSSCKTCTKSLPSSCDWTFWVRDEIYPNSAVLGTVGPWPALFWSKKYFSWKYRLLFIVYACISKLLSSGDWLWRMTEMEMMHPWRRHLCLRGRGKGQTEGNFVELAAALPHLLVKQGRQGELSKAAHADGSRWLWAAQWGKQGNAESFQR